MLYHYNQVALHNETIKQGEWSQSKDFSFTKSPLLELSGKTLGLIGFGNIAQSVCAVATAFGMNIIAYSRTKTDQRHRKNFQWVEKNDLFKSADVISIHCPLNDNTRGLINRDALLMMKKNALLINTARGPVINEMDLAEALNNNTIAAAALDVLSEEPPSADNPLLAAKNCVITPHIAWATKEARTRLLEATVKNISAFLAGRPVNVVN